MGRGMGRGGDEDDDDTGVPAIDERLLWLEARVLSSLKRKADVWAKLLSAEDSRAAITMFADDPDTSRLLVYENSKGEVVASNAPPSKFKRKATYFLKAHSVALTRENIAAQVSFGDVCASPLEQLSAVSQEVFLPLLCNPRNQEGWPEVIGREVVDGMHKFIANVYVTIGQIKGKTLLPLPPAEGAGGEGGDAGAVDTDRALRDKDRIHVLESAVVTWTRQIKNVLKLDPEQLFKDGANPGPLSELEFWAAKASNLNSIHEQLSGEKIRKVVKILEMTKSTYFPAFNRLCREVAAGRVEANDDVKFLAPLKKYFEKLSMGDDFPALVEQFRPIMHLVLLIWKHSKYYNTAPRLVILMRAVCNDLIAQACRYVNGEEIFSIEPEEAVERLKTTLKICGAFKSFYFDTKAKTVNETPENPWRFQNSALFARLDSFLERCHDILDLTQTILQFNKLERIEIGGTKGKTLTMSVRQIYQDFIGVVAKFQNVTYDILDVESKQFDDHFYEFRCVIKELERRLGSVITQAFDDCVTVGMTFKLLDSFEGLLEREIIMADLEKKHADLMQAYGADLKTAADLFSAGRDAPVLAPNAAPHSGTVAWCRGLAARIEEPMAKLRSLKTKVVMESEAAKDITRLYSSVMAAITEYERNTVEAWRHEVDATGEDKLRLPLLLREEASGLPLIKVNFDPMLVRLLREIKYFILLGVEVPEAAMKIYSKAEYFRQLTGNLELIASIYNGVLQTLLEVEQPLVKEKLVAVDKALEKGLTTLNWNSHRIEDFITDSMSMVKDVSHVLTTIKSNVERTRAILDKWASQPMFSRKDGKVYSVEDLEEAQRTLFSVRYNEISEGAHEITKLLSSSNRTLKVSKGAPAWKTYVEYVNDIVVDGLSKAVLASIAYLHEQVDDELMAQNETAPLLEIQLELVAPDILWQPEVSVSSAGNGVRDIFCSWIKGFMHVGALMKRLDIADGSYLKELEENYVVADAVSQVLTIVLENEEKCVEVKESFEKYSYLWTTDLPTALAEFIRDNTPEGAHEPDLDVFDKEIARYKSMQEEIQGLPSSVTCGWLKIDGRPLKQALSTVVTKWSYLFTHHLSSKVVDTMDELYAFVEEAHAELDKDILGEGGDDAAAEGEGAAAPIDRKQSLYTAMRCMSRIRARTDRTDGMFEPLKATVALLKKYSIDLSDAVIKQLDEAPMNWASVKKKMLNVREKLSNLQQEEAAAIRDQSQAFSEEVESFRKSFQAKAPFGGSGAGALAIEQITPAYEVLDRYDHGEVDTEAGYPYGSVTRMVARAAALNDSQDLFEVHVVDYVYLTRCSEEIVALKAMWDMVSVVLFTFSDWQKTLWDSIDTEMLGEEAKKLGKQVKSLDKSVRGFEGFKLIEDAVKAMATSLPLVADLAHPSMRERHWKQLMRATGKNFVMDETFSLGDLLALELHKNVDAVSEIVDRAQKELIIERAIQKIDANWASAQLDFPPIPESELPSVAVDETILEMLENDNLQLQNMSGGKYVQGNPKFLEMVTTWQKKLGAVDTMLGTWLTVQKKWMALESIFVGSADIRVQLPEDSKRFDGTNADFQDLAKSAPDTPNVVEACNFDGRQERLDKMLEELELCEKALNEYLESKRIIFPRFYFVAPADLLEILSKGSNPQLIQKHMPKCFDALKLLEFKGGDDGQPTKMALGMHSKETEYVAFPKECDCSGAVENWLNEVVSAMRGALAAEFRAAVATYDEKPRTKWFFDNSCQNTILTTRVAFTNEIDDAFEQLEDGNDVAIKDCYQKQLDQLAALIELINGDMSKLDRKKMIMLCTLDVHARDVALRLIEERVESGLAFQWQSQLRYYQHETTRDCQVKICDAEIDYMYEYTGVCGCLVITPLTDRCYITLTQAQNLCLGGAPAGPAGTGKTETVKDLSRNLGVQVYVFNCSDQMDYKAMGQIYRGLAQTGAWGCFDEFNRIPVAVLSVCSTQYKVLDAIRQKKDRFVFEEVEISLRRSVMAFITMNPGYPGRAELPESLKALFRPVSMCVPDLQLICEIMLMSEGFLESKLLSRKFVILYGLSGDLLSKAPHYDWKLRAIKTTLYVAGGMKRDQPTLSEDKVLLQALRDFNLGKLTSDDLSIFLGLLNDLFPKLMEEVPRRVDEAFVPRIKKAAAELGYQADETFTLKITQLREIFEVRWSVFLLGPAGCGKSAVYRTLQRAQNMHGEKTITRPINPKAVTRNELYGFLHPSTREWKEGLISVTFRDMANNTTNAHQWIVLDGDIDAEWIESMNTVMDDNKMLTLASNERIPLTNSMRLLLEINHMLHCSPATVSRGGVIYLNDDDIGWQPYVESWIAGLEEQQYHPLLIELFARYLERGLDYVRRNFKHVTPLVYINMAQTVCKILEGMLPSEALPPNAPPPDKKVLEHQFVFATVWALGGALAVDKVHDYKAEFSKWWKAEWKSVIFPEQGSVFDYYVDEANACMAPWADKVSGYTYVNDGDFSSIFVPTVESTRLSYLLDSLVANKHFVMFVGAAGTGKTALMRDKMSELDPEAWSTFTVNMNSFLDAPALQGIIEQPLEKKSGVRFGPQGSRRLIYFVDDMNMPFVDKYDTQSPIELLRQFVDYHGWYDKSKIVLKEVLSSQLLACMNPTAGSFTITPRMQRHFCTFAVQMPDADIVRSIYGAVVEGHMANFDPEVSILAPKLVDATVELHRQVATTFLPSATKFQYLWNLRELSNVTMGLCRMVREYYTDPLKVVRLWVHEVERTVLDRLLPGDVPAFNKMRVTATKKYFEDQDPEAVEARPLLYTSFLTRGPDDSPVYTGVDTYEKLRGALDERLAEYNEGNPVMNLVLFQQAMDHVTRIARIIDLPAGNAMLVGVGGSGKQSLAKLASFICGYEVFMIQITGSYGLADLKENLLSLYTKAGVKGVPVSFVMTDTQIIDERFLVYINDLLSSGYIPDLFAPEDKEAMANAVRNEVKQAGIVDSAENCFSFFIQKVRKYLHVVLCFSPVGDKFRVRARQFPALINNTVFDYFLPWPQEALISVAGRFLTEVPGIQDELRENLAHHMASAHLAATDAAVSYKTRERRYCYTTPKSYLEFIALYKSLLERKRADLGAQRERLESGLDKIAQASAQVADLQANLKQEQIIVDEKKQATDALIVSIGQEKVTVDEAVEGGRADEEECAKIAEEVSAFQAECEEDLKAAEPVIQAAEAALNSLDKASLGELKSFGSPAADVVSVVSACMVLCSPGGKIPKDLSWQAGKKMMGNVNQFLQSLINFDKDNTPLNCVERCEKDFLSQDFFEPEKIRVKSGAAAGLCAWVINICKYFRIYQVVAPKREALGKANKKLSDANSKLTGIRAKVKDLQDRVALLEDNLFKATEDKNAAVSQAEKTQQKAQLADRLINGLAGENKRWGEAVESFDVQETKLIGDSMMSAAFVVYAGPFSATFRHFLTEEQWVPDLAQRDIPHTEGSHPLGHLADAAIKAAWANDGLPTDPLSVENGAIMSSAARWPLMIDPQLQGIKWIKNKEGEAMVILQLSTPRYIDKVEHCIENGVPLMIENLGEDIDAVLDPVIARQTIKRGRNLLIKLGEKEISYDPNFRLYLQSKRSNPHYSPEINAQTTLVNFCVTPQGLEDQLLALVVGKERPDLQQQSQDLVKQLNQYAITLGELEDALLARLAASQGDILEDIALIEGLEETKRTALEIEQKVELAKTTETEISTAREVYRPVAARGSLIYFLIDSLNVLDRVYQYSMANFTYVLNKGIDLTPGGSDQSKVAEERRTEAPVEVGKRVELLIADVSSTIFNYITQGLFEKDKLTMATQLCMMILKQRGELDAQQFDFLTRGPRVEGVDNPLSEWVPASVWASVQALIQLEEFSALADDMVGAAKRWREWMELERPENEPAPGDWKKLPDFQKLLLFRALRPDRLTNAMVAFVTSVIGAKYTQSVPFDLEAAFADTTPGVPIFFFLSPGVDVASYVEAMGAKMGMTAEAGKYAAISLGQGQEEPAMAALQHARKTGGWVLLQNVHLTIDWTNSDLEKVVDKLAEGAEESFRLFISAEPPPSLERGLAISILQNSIKLSNEPPAGLKANLLRAYDNFSQETLESCGKQAEFQSLVFALSYFHAALLERKKFGVGNLPGAASGIGWNMNYPFNVGDLLCCGNVANNYLEANNKVPWEDLRYIFGEIMYGGHVVEDWDRRLTAGYLELYFREELLDGIEFFPGFSSPPSGLNRAQTLEHINAMPAETPLAYGLHPNAEIGFRLREGDALCAAIFSLQPREAGGGEGMSTEDKAKMVLDDLLERLPEQFDVEDLRQRMEEVTPYAMVCLQETERMNKLLKEIRRSLQELDLGLKGDLTMSEPMENLMFALAEDRVSASWERFAYPSLRSLASWLVNLLQRVSQLSEWGADLGLPRVTWLSGLFNPQSFLTAVMQTTARRNDWPLDKTVVLTEVTKKQLDQIEAPARDGAYIHGLTIEGARWDEKSGSLEDSRPKELYCQLPVILVRAVTQEKADVRDVYMCPVYKTERRFREEVFTAQVKSKHPELKWTVAGVAAFLDVA